MTETKNPGEKLTVAPSKPLTLKRSVEQGVVRQSFSHGGTKAVVVEKVKRRVGPGEAKIEAPAAPTARQAAPAPQRAPSASVVPAAKPAAVAPKASGVVLRTLTDEERDRRAHALDDAKVREAEERKIAEDEARRRVDRESKERAERDASEARKRDEDERRKHDEETKRRAEQEVKKRFGDDETKPKTPIDVRSIRPEVDDDEAPRPRRGSGAGAARPAPAPKPARPGVQKSRGRLTLVTALSTDEVRERSVASFRRRVQRMTGHREAEAKEKIAREVVVPETITIQELANRMAERGVDVIKILMKQ